jgi:hypothetical protein
MTKPHLFYLIEPYIGAPDDEEESAPGFLFTLRQKIGRIADCLRAFCRWCMVPVCFVCGLFLDLVYAGRMAFCDDDDCQSRDNPHADFDRPEMK